MTINDAYGNTVIEVTPDDGSYRHREVMGENALTLKFSLAEHVEIPVGATTTFGGETYTLARPEALTMHHSRSFDYTVTMEGEQWRAGIWKFRNIPDGRVKFSLTALPSEHLQLFIDNMNARLEEGEREWAAGECVEHDEVCVCYDHAYCIEALGQMAEAFGTEWEIDGAARTVSLHKVEYHRDDPLPLSYGRGNGLKPDVGRSNSSDDLPVEILYAQGGSDNIDRSKYPQEIHKSQDPTTGETYGGDGTGNAQNNNSGELLLPPNREIGYDGETFHYKEGDGAEPELWSDPEAAEAAGVRLYVVDGQGYYVRRSDREPETKAEDSLDCSEIYPKRVGTVTEVITVDGTDDNGEFQQWYDFTDESIPQDLDYSQCLMDGETMTVIFQSGELAGREFDVNYYHEEVNGKAARRFEIVPDEIDGMVMPGGSFVPKGESEPGKGDGDRYAVFGCMLPNSYICQDSDHSGAEWDMLRECVKYIYENEEQKFTFTGKMDGIWSAQDWDNIGAKVRPGGFILFTDPRFQPEGELVRIVGVKDYINRPHSPELELSNETVTPGFVSTVKEIESREMLVDERHRDSIQFTKRRFRDAQETLTLLEQTVNSLSGQFTEGVSPVAVQTMTMLVGDDALQFRFLNGDGNVIALDVVWVADDGEGTLHVDEGYLQHLTLGVTTVTNADGRQSQEYRTWRIPSAQLTPDDTEARWLYAVVPQSTEVTQEGFFYLSKEALDLTGTDEEGNAVYRLLVGILNGEYGGDRSFAQMYGYTEVSPGRITTGRIVSGDGNTYFDLDSNEIGGTINFADGLISGVIGIGNRDVLKAGLSASVNETGGVKDEDGSVRIWAGADVSDRDTAPFRVTHGGALTARTGVFSGFLQIPFVSLTDVCVKDSAGRYPLLMDYRNILVPRTGSGTTVLLPYSGDSPDLYSGAVFNFFLYYKLSDNFTDTLKVDAGGGFVWFYEGSDDGVKAVRLGDITFRGGYVQLIGIGGNGWIVAVNNARETEPGTEVKGGGTISVVPSTLSFGKDGGTLTATVSSETGWSVDGKPDWITAKYDGDGDGKGYAGETVVTLTAGSNTASTVSRSGTVVFVNADGDTADLPVTQIGASEIFKLTIEVVVSAGFTDNLNLAITVNGGSRHLYGLSNVDGGYTWSDEFEEGAVVGYTVSGQRIMSRSGSVTMDQDRTVTVYPPEYANQ